MNPVIGQEEFFNPEKFNCRYCKDGSLFSPTIGISQSYLPDNIYFYSTRLQSTGTGSSQSVSAIDNESFAQEDEESIGNFPVASHQTIVKDHVDGKCPVLGNNFYRGLKFTIKLLQNWDQNTFLLR
ncbi:hypothetical protein SLA2020_124100 [Shorea laevis]